MGGCECIMTRCWISFVGTSPVAVVNTIWASCKKAHSFIPERVHLIYTEGPSGTKKHAEEAKAMISTLLQTYGIKNPEIILHAICDKPIFEEYEKLLNSIINGETGEIAIDLTPGRKYMSIFLHHIAMNNEKVDRLFYLLLKDNEYLNELYPVIPYQLQVLFDFKSDVNASK